MSMMNQAAAVVLLDQLGRVLLVKENYGRRRWGLPGGVVEDGESPAEAAVREAFEETGLTVELQHLIGLYELCRRHDGSRGLRFIFAGTTVGGTLGIPDTGEIAELAWFEPSAVPAHTTHTAPFAVADARAGGNGVLRQLVV